MAGKLTLDELDRVKKCVIPSAVRLPHFMQSGDRYMSILRQIARINGVPIAPKQVPSVERRCSQSVGPHSDRHRAPAISVDKTFNARTRRASSQPSKCRPVKIVLVNLFIYIVPFGLSCPTNAIVYYQNMDSTKLLFR